jgi:hypothetical protein
VKAVHDAICEEYKSDMEISLYISKWHEHDQWNWENFRIHQKHNGQIDLLSTLHSMIGSDILRIAIDMGVDTPDFIPSIPTFKNELKSDFKTAYDTFTKAFKQIETDPSLAIGLANSALESIIKEILKDERINSKVKGSETLYKLTTLVLKEFNILDDNHPVELRTIGSGLLSINQSIEKLRSEKTNFHGKTSDDYLINDSVYTYFVINSVATVGLFLNSYFKTKFPKPLQIAEEPDNLPF